MEEPLKTLYERELHHLDSHAREFAERRKFRQIAARLGLGDAVAVGDLVETTLQSHTLKSTGASVGALRLSAICSRIESAAKAEDADVVANGVSELAAVFEQSLAAVEADLQRRLAPTTSEA